MIAKHPITSLQDEAGVQWRSSSQRRRRLAAEQDPVEIGCRSEGIDWRAE
jgi:hypothetical protein